MANESAPLGPGSITWRSLGDRRVMLLFGRTGTLQNMHPVVGRALQDHSNFFENPWDRFVRSLPPILGVVYDEQADATGRQVRGFHDGIQGQQDDGRRYHALDPDVFWWTHATFVEAVIAVNELYGTPLTESDKDQVVREGVTWWRRYGMSERPVIDSYAEFTTYWERMQDQVLESNATTDWALQVDAATLAAYPGVPGPVWWLVRTPFMRANLWLMNASMPARARTTLGLQWSRRDELAFRVFAATVRVVWPHLPERVRYLPRARAGMARAGSATMQQAA